MTNHFPVFPPPDRAAFSAGLPLEVRQQLAEGFMLSSLLLSGKGLAFAENMLYLAWLWANGYVWQEGVNIPRGPRRPAVLASYHLDTRADFDTSYFPEKDLSWVYYAHELDSLEDQLRGVTIG